MKQKEITLCLLVAIALLLISAPVLASPAALDAAQYAITHTTIDGGGHMHMLGETPGEERFQLSGTIGQADGATIQGEERFALAGGFWGPDIAQIVPEDPGEPGGSSNGLFLPLITGE